jgi:D-sedoheptulose 7-phosphate isomerase
MEKSVYSLLLKSVNDAVKAAETLRNPDSLAFMQQASTLIADAYGKRKKLIIAGNGGSLCDAMHFAEEMTGQFRFKRRALPAIALSDPAHMSCVGNDYGFEEIFSRGVEALGEEGDVLVVLTTSGNSINILHAIKKAKEKNMRTIAFLGKTGGVMRGQSELEWIVSGFPFSDRIQEAHMAAIHIIIELVEQKLFSSPYASTR